MHDPVVVDQHPVSIIALMTFGVHGHDERFDVGNQSSIVHC